MAFTVRLTSSAARTATAALALLCGCGDSATAQADASIRAPLAAVVTRDTTVRAATRALEAGRPWEATRMLAPLLKNPARRSNAAVLRAAEAASGWEGWNEVLSLLQNESWLAKEFGGHGYVLLTRAALALSPQQKKTDSAAVRYAQLAVPIATGRAERGERETLLARAHERLQNFDSARVHYVRASQQLPEASDWLRLRAASVTRDERARLEDYKNIRGVVARERIDGTEANARENSGDSTGAITIYEKTGELAAAFRLRLATAPEDKTRAAVRSEMVAYLVRSPLPVGARNVIAALDSSLGANAGSTRVASASESTLSNEDELVVARAAAAINLNTRAAVGYARAFKASLGDDRDRFRYSEVLFRLGRFREAATQFGQIPSSSTLAGSASYQNARSLLRAGDGTAAKRALVETRDRFRADTLAASSALYLLGDLASDASADADARRYFLELVRSYPGSAFAPQAMLHAAIIAFIGGEAQQAAREFDAFNAAKPTHSELQAARYWSGRAWKQAGNDSAAANRWRAVVTQNGASYYAMLSARALGEPVWAPSSDTSTSMQRTFADIDSAHHRARLLENLGLLDEARLEDDRLVRDAGTSIDRLLATSRGFSERGNSSRAIALARRALDLGAPPNVAIYRLMYPVAQEGVLLAEAARSDIDPSLLAALIRQESNFTPHATSAVGARGLMQLMPSVGGSIARGIGFVPWDPVLLYQADVNVQLGVRHLSGALGKYTQLGQALAAYNAGDSRVARWKTKAGGNDPELFVERIPFVETRDYVRIILRNKELYRSLYRWAEK